MEIFRPWRGGYLAKADATERRFIAGLAQDVSFMLGHPIEEKLEDDKNEENISDDDLLAAYETELTGIDGDDDAERGPEMMRHGPIDEAFHRLLPDMSENPEDARVLRELTADALAAIKSEQLLVFWKSVNGPTDDVWVGNEEMPAWLAAADSLRLVMAARLNIHDEETSEAVYALSNEITGADGRGKEREVDSSEDLLAVLYTMISWWQESLLHAVNNKRLRT